MSTIPQTGEKLPDYDDGPADGADIEQMYAWLRTRYGWGYGEHQVTDPRALIRGVLAALQAAGDATLVKNPTYRAMRQDGVRVERLAARLANTGRSGMLVEHGGDPVSVVLTILAEIDADQAAPPPAVTG